MNNVELVNYSGVLTELKRAISIDVFRRYANGSLAEGLINGGNQWSADWMAIAFQQNLGILAVLAYGGNDCITKNSGNLDEFGYQIKEACAESFIQEFGFNPTEENLTNVRLKLVKDFFQSAGAAVFEGSLGRLS